MADASSPDWRHARRKLAEMFEREALAARESGKLKTPKTASQIRDEAEQRATREVEIAIRHQESPENVLARKRKTSEAA